MHDLNIKSRDAILAASYSPAGDVVVVALHGASEGTRESPLLQHLHRLLPPIGVGVVTFDRRGEGASSGEPSRGFFETQVDDALAIAQSLDVGTIGLWGYSQGAWIAPLAAGESDLVSFVVGIASTGVTPSRQMNYAVAEQLRHGGYESELVDRAVGLRLAYEAELHGSDVCREELAEALLAASKESWWELVYLPSTPLEPKERSQWIAEMDFDPLPSFRSLTVPVLLFYGEEDMWSPVAASVSAWRDAQGDNATIVVIPGVGHDLRDAGGEISATYESELEHWLRASILRDG